MNKILLIQPGDVINTSSLSKFGLSWKRLSRWTVAQGIQLYQRHMRGYPKPSWQRTHSRLVLRNGLCLSVDDPFCIFEDIEEVIDAYPEDSIQILRPKFYDYSKGDGIEYLEEAAYELRGTKYDRGQLIDIMLNRLLKIPDDEFVRVFDAGTMRTVCSGGIAACYEFHRRETNRQWERLFGGMYIERIPPAAFEALPRNAHWSMEFEIVGENE